jgi:hypothetical protein
MQKKLYQITDKVNSRKIAEFLSKDDQLLLPLLDLIRNIEQAVDELIDVVGKAVIESVLLLSAQQTAGPKQPGRITGDIGWHDRQFGVVSLSERKLRIEKPRLRKKGKGAGKEVAVPAYDAMVMNSHLGTGNAQMVVRYDISSANDEPERDPKDWLLLASNVGSNWTTLDICSGELFANRYQMNQYTISNSTAYRYYRLNITSNFSGSVADGIQLSELTLMVQAPTFSSGLINNLDGVESRDYISNSLSNYVTAPGGTFGKTSGPDWLAMALNGTLSGIPLNSNVGENIFTVRVEGLEGLFDTATMTIQVANTYSGTQGMEDLAGNTTQWPVTGCVDIPPVTVPTLTAMRLLTF